MTDSDTRLIALVRERPRCTANWYAARLDADPYLTRADLDRLTIAGHLTQRRAYVTSRRVNVYAPAREAA